MKLSHVFCIVRNDNSQGTTSANFKPKILNARLKEIYLTEITN